MITLAVFTSTIVHGTSKIVSALQGWEGYMPFGKVVDCSCLLSYGPSIVNMNEPKPARMNTFENLHQNPVAMSYKRIVLLTYRSTQRWANYMPHCNLVTNYKLLTSM